MGKQVTIAAEVRAECKRRRIDFAVVRDIKLALQEAQRNQREREIEIRQVAWAEATSRGCWPFWRFGFRARWGKLLWVSPLLTCDPVDLKYLTCVHKPESVYRMGLEQRRWMKRKLGRRHRSLVQAARTRTKTDFFRLIADAPADYAEVMRKRADESIPRHLCGTIFVQPDAEAVIRNKLQMTVGEFWQHAKGKPIDPERMVELVQMEFFPQ